MQTAEKWMDAESRNLSPEHIALLARAKKTLERNIAVPEKENHCDPLPWYPLRGIRPASNGYEGIWNWDSAFHAMAISRWDIKFAQEQIQIFLDAQQESGLLPDVLFMDGTLVTTFGKPPVFPWAVMLMDRRHPDDQFLKAAYEKFIRYEGFWMRDRGGSSEGLFHYDGASTEPARHLKDARLESGWDDSVRFDEATYDMWHIDLNCYMVMLYRSMAYFAERLSKPDDVTQWKSREQELTAQINERLWDPEANCYFDRFRSTNKFSRVFTPASFMPLFIEIADTERAKQLAEHAANPELFFPGMPTVAYNHPAYVSNKFWRGPTWLNTAFFALRGLKDYGFHDLADTCRNTILGWCSDNQDALYEYYDSRSGKGCGNLDFGWSAAFVTEFILSWD